MNVEVDSVDVGLDRGERHPPGLSMNMCAAIIAGTVLAGAFAGGNSYYLEELFSALLLFALVALPLLALVFCLVMVEAGAESRIPWAKARSLELTAWLRCLAQARGQHLFLYRHAASGFPEPRTVKSANPSVDSSFVATRNPPKVPGASPTEDPCARRTSH
jgi:hypothetical protein